MFSVISLALFGAFMTVARSGTGILYQLGDDWYIDNIGIRNPHLFPHILILENNGKEVHYIHSQYPDPDASIPANYPFRYSIYFFTLDLVPVFIIKQIILYICIAISSVVVFTYLYLNRKRFPITNKLLG
jgi:hypothetical protein